MHTHSLPPPPPPPNTHKHTLSFWLPSTLTTVWRTKKKQALSCGTHEAAYIFIISVPYSTSPLDACLLASLFSPQFPWCLTCLQPSSVILHCSGIVKKYALKLLQLNLLIPLSVSLKLYIFDLHFKLYVCFICTFLNFTWWFCPFVLVFFFSSSWVSGGCHTAGNPSVEGGRTLKAAWRASITTGTTLRTWLAGRSWTPPAL